MNYIKYILISVLLIALSGCGNGRKSISSSAESSTSGSVKMIVNRSKSAGDEKRYSIIEKYRVIISGPGISDPIEKEFDGDAAGGVVEGVPSGEDRLIKVEAVNLDKKLIREGQKNGVKVSAGTVSEVEVSMDAVPIFVNIDDGSVVLNNRLKMELFADPEDPLEVRDLADDSSGPLTDLSTNLNEVYPDAKSGIAVMSPNGVSVGEHQFEAVSKRTGKSSNVKVRIIDGTKLRPAPLFSGGHADWSEDSLKASRIGSPWLSGAGSGSVWPNYLGVTLTAN